MLHQIQKFLCYTIILALLNALPFVRLATEGLAWLKAVF